MNWSFGRRGRIKGEVLGLLGSVGMLSAAINLELTEELAAKGIVGQHAFDGLFNNALRQTGLEMGKGFSLHAARSTGMASINLLSGFVAAHTDLFSVDDDNKIPCIQMGCEGGLVLAPQDLGHFTGQASEGLISRINHEPLTVEGIG
jgi:hypothetical protein